VSAHLGQTGRHLRNQDSAVAGFGAAVTPLNPRVGAKCDSSLPPGDRFARGPTIQQLNVFRMKGNRDRLLHSEPTDRLFDKLFDSVLVPVDRLSDQVRRGRDRQFHGEQLQLFQRLLAACFELFDRFVDRFEQRRDGWFGRWLRRRGRSRVVRSGGRLRFRSGEPDGSQRTSKFDAAA